MMTTQMQQFVNQMTIAQTMKSVFSIFHFLERNFMNATGLSVNLIHAIVINISKFIINYCPHYIDMLKFLIISKYKINYLKYAIFVVKLIIGVTVLQQIVSN